MRRLILVVVLAVAVAVFGSAPSIGVVAGPDNEAPYTSHVDPLGEGGSLVPKVDSDPVGEGGSYVPKADGPGEGGSYVPKVAMAETDDSSTSSSEGSEATGGISG